MSYIKKNVNFGLLLMVILLAVAISALGIYYNQNYSNLSEKYNNQLFNLRRVTDDLLLHKSRLNETAVDLRLKEEDESDLSKRYSGLRADKEQLDKNYATLKADFNRKSLELTTAKAELKNVQQQKDVLSAQATSLTATVSRLQLKLENCQNNLDTCQGN